MEEKDKNKGHGLWLFFLVTGVLFVGFLLVKKNNVIRWIQAGYTLKQQERTIRQYRKDIAEMDVRIDALTNNRDSIEKFAREKFNFTEPGDDVYL